MLMLATLLAAQCVSCVWWNASECNNTSFSALIKFFDVSKRRRPISSGGTNTPSLRSASRRFLFIYLFIARQQSPPPPPITVATHRSGSRVSDFLSATLRGEQNKRFLEFLSRWTNHAAALGARFWHSHLFVIAK